MNILLGLVLPAVFFAASKAPLPPYIPGEILVKFVPGTEGSAAVTRASQMTPPDLGVLAPIINHLDIETGIPLKATQVTGGNWVLLSVDNEKMTNRIVGQLQTRKNVAKVEARIDKPATPAGISSSQTLVITFVPGSAESKAVSKKVADATYEGFNKLIHEMEKHLELPLKGEVAEEAKLLLRIDLKALTPIFVERLKTVSTIESAQPNYIETIR